MKLLRDMVIGIKALFIILSIVFFSITMPVAYTSYYNNTYSANLVHEYLTFILLMDGENLNAGHDTFSIECIVTLELNNNKITNIKINSLNVMDPPGYGLNIKKFVIGIIAKWLDKIVLYDLEKSGETGYVSVNGKIIETYIIRKNDGIEYREKNTGLFMGGIHIVTYTSSLEETHYISSLSRLTYGVKIQSYLIAVKPDTILDKLYVIEPPIQSVRVLGSIISIVLGVLALYTLSRWDDYRII